MIKTIKARVKQTLHKHNRYLLAFFILLLSACSEDNGELSTDDITIKVAILPDRNKEVLQAKHLNFFNYLTQKTGVNYQIIVPANYNEALNLFIKNEVQMAFLGGVTFLKAHLEINAIPLVSRYSDTKFTSVILTSTINKAQKVADLKNHSFSFGSQLSTSGHLMPRYFLQEKNISPELFFSKVTYSGAHDKTALLVEEGHVEAGALNSQVAENMFNDGRLTHEMTKILWRSPKFQDYVWAISPDVAEQVTLSIREAFLDLSEETPEMAAILRSLNAEYFVPVGLNDFTTLQQILTQLKVE